MEMFVGANREDPARNEKLTAMRWIYNLLDMKAEMGKELPCSTTGTGVDWNAIGAMRVRSAGLLWARCYE